MTQEMTSKNRCLYGAKLKDFLQLGAPAIIGILSTSYNGPIESTQRDAWNGEIEILQGALKIWEQEDAYIFFEYEIPRLGKRIDAVLLLKGIIFCLEFKVGEKDVLRGDLEQVLDYALDLKNFHKFSLQRPIVPIWIEAINTSFPDWDIHISPQLTAAEYAEGKVQDLLKANPRAAEIKYSEALHLAVSLRSFRAERLSDFVHALLAIDEKSAALYQEVVKVTEGRPGYPIYLTRDINKARAWLRQMARGTSRTGVLVSKVAARFKPQAINVLAQGDEYAVHWFLEDKDDVRSSNYLEDAATEIQVQGLELDYTCVLWDADFRYEEDKWGYYKFNGKTAWTIERNDEAKKYMLNAYRVLLTRARQGMVICVPEGNPKKNAEGFPEDPTRLPEFYNGTYNYLKGLGLYEL